MRLQRERSQGFSLIELLIVVTIILIIAAIALPKLLTVKQQANAAATVANLHTLNNALNAYSTEWPSIGYPPLLTGLASPSDGTPPSSATAGLIDDALANSATVAKQGYLYTYTPVGSSPATSFSISAAPVGGSGSRYFYMDQDGVIRFNDGSPATAASAIIG